MNTGNRIEGAMFCSSWYSILQPLFHFLCIILFTRMANHGPWGIMAARQNPTVCLGIRRRPHRTSRHCREASPPPSRTTTRARRGWAAPGRRRAPPDRSSGRGPPRAGNEGLLYQPAPSVQGDHSHCSQPPVDNKTKVLF